MDRAEVLAIVQGHFESLFPRSCTKCGRRFGSLLEYIQVTQRVGPVKSYDAELRDWRAPAPIGSFAMSNCPCGTTISLTTDGLPLDTRHALLAWVKAETERQGITPTALLEGVRSEVRQRVLSERDPMALSKSHGKICYIELPATDVKRSADFYAKVFGWNLRTRGDGATAFDDAAGQVSGAFVTGRQPSAAAPGMLLYVMVNDIAATSTAVEANGGKMLQRHDPKAREIVARFSDPAGNVLGLYQESGH